MERSQMGLIVVVYDMGIFPPVIEEPLSSAFLARDIEPIFIACVDYPDRIKFYDLSRLPEAEIEEIRRLIAKVDKAA